MRMSEIMIGPGARVLLSSWHLVFAGRFDSKRPSFLALVSSGRQTCAGAGGLAGEHWWWSAAEWPRSDVKTR